MTPFLQWVGNPFEHKAQAWHCDTLGIWRLDREDDAPGEDWLSGLEVFA